MQAPPVVNNAISAADPAALNRLRWRCRRGLLENDLFIARFFDRYGTRLTTRDLDAMSELMELSDGDLLDYLTERKSTREANLSIDALQVLKMMAER